MTLTCSGNVQYVNAYLTSSRVALCGDRSNTSKSDPIFELYNDDVAKQVIFKIVDVISEDMYKFPKERLDVYILKPGAEILMNGLNSLVSVITSATKLDRSIRDPKDSRYKYDDTGLPLRIDATEGWIKIDNVRACFAERGLSIDCTRDDVEDDIPKLNIDLEWNNTRLHFGVESSWNLLHEVYEFSHITIQIPWSEFAHFLSAIRNTVPKMR